MLLVGLEQGRLLRVAGWTEAGDLKQWSGPTDAEVEEGGNQESSPKILEATAEGFICAEIDAKAVMLVYRKPN